MKPFHFLVQIKTQSRALFAAVFLAALVLALPGCAGKPDVRKTEPAEDAGPAGITDRLLSPEAEELVRTGILYHDRGDYETALDYYGKAMEIAPEHPVICYEMGFSFLYMGDPDKALEMVNRGIAAAEKRGMDDILPGLYDLKGSALDDLGRSEEAIEVYLAALERYNAANTLLYYNLAVSYYRIERREEAKASLVQGLLLSLNHASSNYLLARLYMEDGKRTQAFFPMMYFLLLEPNTSRSAEIYNAVLDMLTNTTESIGFSDNGSFTASDLIISLSFTLDEANKRKSDAEKIRAKLFYILSSLEEQKNSGAISRSKGDELWWDFYSPFLCRIARSDYFETFCRYIALSADPEAEEWIETGREEIDGFFEWLNEYNDGEDSPEE